MQRKLWPIWLGAAAFVLWMLYGLLALSTVSASWLPDFMTLPVDGATSVLASRGQFGDAFGAFNALISTFALIGLFFTLHAQQIQINEQSKANKSFDLLARQQQFQEQYFRAVDTYRELLSSVSYTTDHGLLTGRAALWAIWRELIVAPLATAESTPFVRALHKQIKAYSNAGLGDWNTNSEAIEAIGELTGAIAADGARAVIVQRIGVVWAAAYSMHRFQMDSLFRSWYTVYRVLDTADKYELPDETIRLYSASFRAQLSWIEMAFLLANQSALPGNPAFPRACHFSNRFRIFDNLEVSNDAVVAVLYQVALRNAENALGDEGQLCRRAFAVAD